MNKLQSDKYNVPYCHLMSHGISIEKDCIRVCCLTKDAEKTGRPILVNSYDINNFSWNNIIEAKKKQIESFCRGEVAECEGCYAIKYNASCEEKNDNYISYINLNHWSECNCDCIYCGHNKKKEKRKNTKQHISYTKRTIG